MIHAIILAGGIGSRMKMSVPKQYQIVNGVPVFLYSIRKFVADSRISSIVLVISDEWRTFVEKYIASEHVGLPVFYAPAGKSRQHSVLSGLTALSGIAGPDDLVFVHDSVRPLFPSSIIDDCIIACSSFDAAIPVITVKDATYRSSDGKVLTDILPRSELFSGQSPECFRYQSYLSAHAKFDDNQLMNIRGCSELAFRSGMKVRFVEGNEGNFKITTIEDLKALKMILE